MVNVDEIPDDHPRAASLRERHKIIEGMHNLVVTEAGLIAHGRGEAFDYLIGEKSNSNSINTMKVSVAVLMLAEHPIISVNGNVTALCPKEMIEFANELDIPLEINLFYGKPGRIEAITEVLKKHGAKTIYGTVDSPKDTIKELSSNRRIVDPRGIKKADVVLVPLEDGDRTEALVREGKKVIAIDLNPLTRTAQQADITIVDNVQRVFPKMTEIARDFKNLINSKKLELKELKELISKFDNKINLKNSIEIIIQFLKKQEM